MANSLSGIRTFIFAGAALVAIFTVAGCNTSSQPATPAAPPDTRAADETAIRAADADWAANGAEKKDVAKYLSFYADNAKVLGPGSPMEDGKPAISAGLTGLFSSPGVALTFRPASVTVSRSGDMAYEIGEYVLTLNDDKGKPQTVKRKYLVVWGKQADGSWKVQVEAPTTAR